MNRTDRNAPPAHNVRDAFFKYWNNIYSSELRDLEGWKPVYSCGLPPAQNLLREDRIPYKGDYASIDELGNIVARIEAERFVLMMMPYLPLDRATLFDVLVVDVDCDFDLELLLDAGVPQPRYYACRRRRPGDPPTLLRRPHLVYWLSKPVKRWEQGRVTKAARYYEAIRKGLQDQLEDLGLNVDRKRIDLSKNPHHDFWDTVQGEYRDWSLDELSAALKASTVQKSSASSTGKPVTKRKSARQPNFTQSIVPDKGCLEGYGGRNELVFHTTRMLAYRQKRFMDDDAALRSWIHETAHELNTNKFTHYSKGPMEHDEVERIACSVADFVIERYVVPTDPKDRGACSRKKLIHDGMTTNIKQVIGGKYGARKNAENTQKRVVDAFKQLSGGGATSVTQVAQLAGVSRPTARKWMRQIEKEAIRQTASQVENTVAIKKVEKKVPLVLHVPDSSNAGLSGAINVISYACKPLGDIKGSKVVRASDLKAAYSHPFDRSMGITETGEVVRLSGAKKDSSSLKGAPTRLLDIAGFFDDPEDEYAPPIGEEDHYGHVWYPAEEYQGGQNFCPEAA